MSITPSSCGWKFIIELCPPVNSESIPKYCDKIADLLKHTNSFSLTSHPSGPITGFDKSYNLARYMRSRWPSLELDLTIHLTCRDLNRVNIFARFDLLKTIGVSSVLVISGEDYSREKHEVARPEHVKLFFRDSEDILKYIRERRKTHGEFEWLSNIAVAAFPDGHPKRNLRPADEVARLYDRVKDGANLIFTQCIFSITDSLDCVCSELRLGGLGEVVYSIALFDSLESLDKCLKLTRVASIGEIGGVQANFPLESSGRAFVLDYLSSLCNKFASYQTEGCTNINICCFGKFDMAIELINQLTGGK